MKRAKRVCIILLFLALMCPAARAHHLWVMSSGQKFFAARGLAPDRLDTFDPRHVVMLKTFDRSGREIPVRRTDQAQRASFSAQGAAAMTAVVCEWGGRVNTPEGKKLLSKRQALAQG